MFSPSFCWRVAFLGSVIWTSIFLFSSPILFSVLFFFRNRVVDSFFVFFSKGCFYLPNIFDSADPGLSRNNSGVRTESTLLVERFLPVWIFRAANGNVVRAGGQWTLKCTREAYLVLGTGLCHLQRRAVEQLFCIISARLVVETSLW